jgi:hypothetical protein
MRLGAPFLLAALCLGSAPAWAGVITFDDLTTRNNFFDLGINSTYQGYVWSNTLIGGETGQTGWGFRDRRNPSNSTGAHAREREQLCVELEQFGAATDVTGAYLATLSSTYSFNASSVQLFGYDASNALVDTGSSLL